MLPERVALAVCFLFGIGAILFLAMLAYLFFVALPAERQACASKGWEHIARPYMRMCEDPKTGALYHIPR